MVHRRQIYCNSVEVVTTIELTIFSKEDCLWIGLKLQGHLIVWLLGSTRAALSSYRDETYRWDSAPPELIWNRQYISDRESKSWRVSNVQHLLLVGGFGESPYLRRRLAETYERNGTEIVTVEEPSYDIVVASFWHPSSNSIHTHRKKAAA
jgi:hypothetical protein